MRNPADDRYYFEDVIGSAGSADTFIKHRHPFHDEALLREVPGAPYAPQGYADPRVLKTHFQYDVVIDPPPPEVTARSFVNMASPMPVSWNQIVDWLRLLEGLRYVS